MGWSLIDFTADLTGRTSDASSTPALLLILSKQKIFRYFMHMRAKTICGFALTAKSVHHGPICAGSYPTFDP